MSASSQFFLRMRHKRLSVWGLQRKQVREVQKTANREQGVEKQAGQHCASNAGEAKLGRQSEDASRTDVSTDTELFKPDRMRE
jgi:hypothetical protein